MRNLLPAKPISYLLLAPSILVLLSLVLYPMAFALVNSFYFWNLQTSPQPMFYNGLANYRMVFQVTPFVQALRNERRDDTKRAIMYSLLSINCFVFLKILAD